jgi:hypothetical protein
VAKHLLKAAEWLAVLHEEFKDPHPDLAQQISEMGTLCLQLRNRWLGFTAQHMGLDEDNIRIYEES